MPTNVVTHTCARPSKWRLYDTTCIIIIECFEFDCWLPCSCFAVACYRRVKESLKPVISERSIFIQHLAVYILPCRRISFHFFRFFFWFPLSRSPLSLGFISMFRSPVISVRVIKVQSKCIHLRDDCVEYGHLRTHSHAQTMYPHKQMPCASNTHAPFR